MTKLTTATKQAMKIITAIMPVIIKWDSLPWEKSRLRLVSVCTPKKAAATLLNVCHTLLWKTKSNAELMEAIMDKLN